MALLQTEQLTMRFGGITAVNRVDLAVEPGQIFSVIGPNGAGKTTVFNAVTGIYEPTAGRVLFRGRPIERPLTWRPAAGALLVGLLTGLACLLLAVNVDALWKVAIRQNHAAREAFPWGKAASDAAAHVAARGGAAAGGFAFGFVVGAAGMLTTWWRSRRTPDVISRGGIARTFQNIRLFQSMTVLENVQVGMSRAVKGHPLAALLHLPAHRREEAELRA
jgi:ABC-type branched-subunit amino acid transport system ATPase component